ncbi:MULTISPECIES: alpha/beta fold hydrolase [unclassified Streptomyces]|uniref:alpha/beta fold hydrolase n=1 Tax=unclassified Streptomyces TaxID=2593676 RepID=UPI0004BF7B2B|nr:MULTISPECIES: alpha/beta hydrolase [unclassified Streptomyces]
MASTTVNGIRIHYASHGSGEPVVMVAGSGSGGRVWHLHQVPHLTAAGYRVITFDNRGIAPSDPCAEGFTVQDMVADTAALIERLSLGRCRLVGHSLGAQIVQELALSRPDLVDRAVLIATRGRSDVLRRALAEAELALHDSAARLPASYKAVVRAMQNLSPHTLANAERIDDWLALLEMSAAVSGSNRAQLALSAMPDRLDAYRKIERPCAVVAFADDLITPAQLGREVAEVIPGASFQLIERCGHYGYLEDPGSVNKAIAEFFGSVR